jgi:glycerol uptake facilitator-like aquaporin
MSVLYIMIESQYVGEAIGMFVFVYIALTQTEPITIAIALFIGILIAITFKSKAYLNPGIAIADYVRGSMTGDETIKYIGAELSGVALSLGLLYLYNNK